MQVKILQADSDAEALSGLLLNQVDEIRMAARAIHEKKENNRAKQNGKHDHGRDPPRGCEQRSPEGEMVTKFELISAVGRSMDDCHESVPQNAWPMLMKYCVEFTPGTGFRLCPM